MEYSIQQIADAIGGKVLGNPDLAVTGVAEPSVARADQLALAMRPAFADKIRDGAARSALLWAEADWSDYPLDAAILVTRPRLAMAGLTATFDPGQRYPRGIDPSAMIESSAVIGENVSIGPMTYVGPDAKIGDNTQIGPQCFIGTEAQIGTDAVIHAGVRIMARVRIGDRFRVSSGTVIGSDGHSFVTPQESAVEQARASLGTDVTAKGQAWVRIHSLGSVVIGDDVEIGANTVVDSGTMVPTTIGNGTKIDNLCQIAHNVRVGENCLFAGQVGIAGSTVIGNNVVLAGQVGVSDNISIGDDVVVGGGSKVMTKVPAGRVMLGYPATKMDMNVDLYKYQRRLPRLFAQVAALQKAVFKGGEND